MKRFFTILFALTLVVLTSCGNRNDEDSFDKEFEHINLNPYERLISATVNQYNYIMYLVEVDYDPWTKILYKRSNTGKIVYMAVITEHRHTVHHDSKNIEWTDSAEAVMINNSKQINTILKKCNNNPSEEDKKKNEDDNVSVGNSARPKTISADAGGGFGGGIRRAVTNFGGYKRANSQIKNKVELVLYKDEKLTKQKVKRKANAVKIIYLKNL